jgi:hypothetical protein
MYAPLLLALLALLLLQQRAAAATPLPGWISRDLNGDNETFACAVAAGLLNRHYSRPAAVMQHKFGATTYGNHDAEWLKIINRTNATVQATEFATVDARGMLSPRRPSRGLLWGRWCTPAPTGEPCRLC